ncbi:NUDIX domain-containing protein [Leptolyngbya sp. FACHB-261]|nr:NUDIX domain-containing protein [Leptolyngbya sp. FACHB-261]
MTQPVEVAIACLRYDDPQRGDLYLMQLRDDLPNIAWPAHWAFFGGHLEQGENPSVAMRRELLEEIGHAPKQLTLYRSDTTSRAVIRHVFQGTLGVSLDQLCLQEGEDMGLFTPQELRSGALFSQKLGRTRKIAQPHLEILLEILET